MIRTVGRELWCFDVEWVPDVEAGKRLYGLRPDTEWSERDYMEWMWHVDPGYDREKNPRPFLKTILCRVVSIAVVRRYYRTGQVVIEVKAIERDSERAMLDAFLRAIGEFEPQLVGWNSKGADLPALVQRAMACGVVAEKFCRRPEKPWLGIDYFAKENDHHLDLMNLVGGYGRATPSLSEACAALDIMGAKTTTGADVADLWLDGNTKAIHAYCMSDAVRTFGVFLRLAVLAGKIHPEQAEIEFTEAVTQWQRYLDAALAEPAGELALDDARPAPNTNAIAGGL